MKFIADIHIHSHYSRATSKNLDFEHLTQWAQLKGVNLLATGDVAHPSWLQEMKDKLEPAEDGLFRLKPAYAQAVSRDVPAACQAEVRFILGGEISSIYKKHDRVRKVHNLIFAPSLDAVEKIQAALEKIGNIRSDGRPILGLPSRDLLETILEVDSACCLIPAHIWTPWFSLLGSKSGYDSVEACFEDLSDHIFALETGLSSDPPMNWRVSALDGYTLVSNSDAHSPPKLAREATLLNTEPSYQAIFDALKSGDPAVFGGTLEFFPEEGKYHHDGHRKCSINWDPKETIAHDGRCAVCGKPVTVGVLHRVEALADRPDGATPARSQPFASLIPLPEVLGEIHGVGPNTKTVRQAFDLLLAKLGPELAILRDIPLAEIEQVGGTRLAEGIRRMRAGQVRPIAGFDGQPGVIKLFNPNEDDLADGQL
ncbi:MAG TPA: endonuclease Q family protein, partial [Anaerolineae bacterium]|nr:endonuclease Q family protein [Anaerolineae bacterium]